MWTADNRPRYNRDKLRYPSDLTDESPWPNLGLWNWESAASRARSQPHGLIQ